MFSGWPENAYALRVLHEMFRHELKSRGVEVALGALCLTSISAHLYMDTWEAAQGLVADHLWAKSKPWTEYDPKGQFDVRAEGENICVEMSDGEKRLCTFTGSTAKKVCNLVASAGATDNVSNAMFMAREAQKIEDNRRK